MDHYVHACIVRHAFPSCHLAEGKACLTNACTCDAIHTNALNIYLNLTHVEMITCVVKTVHLTDD